MASLLEWFGATLGPARGARQWRAPPDAQGCALPFARLRAVRLREEDERRLHTRAYLLGGLGVGEIELEEDRVDVLLHRTLREHERLGDRRIALSFGDGGEHLELARGELRQG